MDISKSIKERSSVRTYSDREVEGEKLERIRAYLKDLEAEGNSNYRFQIINTRLEGKLGTYGVIKNAKYYIGAVAREENLDLVRLGYLFEKLIIYLTGEGLGTCWLGGTFNRGDLGQLISLEENEGIVALTPFGYGQEKRSLVDASMRKMIRADTRKPFEEIFFSLEEGQVKPLNKSGLGPYEEALEGLRIAPSASNKQPWRILVDKHGYNLYLERTKNYGDKLAYDIQYLDMGIAQYHFQAILSEKNIRGEFKDLKKENLGEWIYISTWLEEK